MPNKLQGRVRMVPSLAAGEEAVLPFFPTRSKRFALRGMVPSPTPKRDHGSAVSRLRSEGKVKLVRAEGLEPSRTLRSNGFSCPLRLSPRPTAFAMGFGVWTIPSPYPDLAPDVRCCPSSLYTFPAVSGRAWLGIATLQGSPTLSSSASPVSRRALKFLA